MLDFDASFNTTTLTPELEKNLLLDLKGYTYVNLTLNEELRKAANQTAYSDYGLSKNSIVRIVIIVVCIAIIVVASFFIWRYLRRRLER